MPDTITLRGKSFALQVAEWAEQTKLGVDKSVRAITIALFSGIIQATPVDPGGAATKHVGGQARGNWQTSVGAPLTGTIDREDKTGAASIAEVTANLGGSGKVTWLSNNLPYIQVLEYGGYPNPPKLGTRLAGGGYEIRSVDGYSRQSPAGMVRINMGRIQQIVSDSVAASKK